MDRFRSPSLLICVAILACIGLYWQGLFGPLILDDLPNFKDISRYLAGERSAWLVIFDNRSGPLGRPVSMASFMANVAVFGRDVFWLKAVNLGLHLANGLLAYAVLRRLLAAMGTEVRAAHWSAAILAVLWLLHPAHVSTVLYAVQRMTLLSAFFSLICVLIYLHARPLPAVVRAKWLLIVLPLCLGLGLLSKENAATVVPLLAFLEWSLFSRFRLPRERDVQAFFLLFLILPTLLVLGYLAIRPDFLLRGYEQRDFSLTERLLTQMRVLWSYIGTTLIPNGPQLGVFHDDYPVSRGLLSPPSTLLGIASGIVAGLVAWCWRNTEPALWVGSGVFLIGHSLEAGPFALELFFLHRNYLPSLGVLLYVYGLYRIAEQRAGDVSSLRRLALTISGLLLVTLSFATFSRALVWGDESALYQQELRTNPQSIRLRATLMMNHVRAGDLDAALEQLSFIKQHTAGKEAMVVYWELLAHCYLKAPLPVDFAQAYEKAYERKIRRPEMIAFEEVVNSIEKKECIGLDGKVLLNFQLRRLQGTDQSPLLHDIWRMYYNTAKLAFLQGELPLAVRLADVAWNASRFNNGVGIYLFELHALSEQWVQADRILARLSGATGHGDHRFDQRIAELRELRSRIGPPSDYPAPTQDYLQPPR